MQEGEEKEEERSRKTVYTDNAPKPIGPYSQAIVVNGFVYTAGQGANDPKTGKWGGGDIKEQTALVLENIKAVLEAAGSSLDRVVKTSVFIQRKELFAEMNEVYARYFATSPPARTTVVSNLLRDDMLVEIDAIATV